jgi:PUB domain
MMRLRLNGDGGGSLSSHYFTNEFEHDVNISSTTKVDVFNFICIVIKNLIDKPNDMKYRQLRLNNSKIQRYTSHISIMNYLQHIIGFDRITDTMENPTPGSDTEEPLLRIVDESRLPSPEVLQEEFRSIKSIIQRLESTVGGTSSIQPRVVSNSSSSASLESDEKGTSVSTSATATYTGRMTEKQKARILMEEKIALQKLQDEQARKRTIQQIQNDKYVRQNDPNWKPSVSAAAAKSGDTMSTFRDKFGEN